jgi:hypothetical protein
MADQIDCNNTDPQVESLLEQMLLAALAQCADVELPSDLKLHAVGNKPAVLTVAMTINGLPVPAEAVLSRFCEEVFDAMGRKASELLLTDPAVVEFRRKINAGAAIFETAHSEARKLFPKKEEA